MTSQLVKNLRGVPRRVQPRRGIATIRGKLGHIPQLSDSEKLGASYLDFEMGTAYDPKSIGDMYGPPSDCKGKVGESAQMYSAFGWSLGNLCTSSATLL